MSNHLTAQEAADALGISKATLYAYTSRGQLRSETASGRSRERRYHREDIERLQQRKEARRDPAKAVAKGLRWGSPVLESGITLISDGKVYYRGMDALALAREATLEQTAALLWAGSTEWEQAAPRSPRRSNADPISAMQAVLPILGAADLSAHDLRPEAVRLTGARILRALTSVVTGSSARIPIHRALQSAWAPGKEAAGEAIRIALVLCADHELNVSTFVARCAASAGASPYDVVSAALATLKGHRHGGAGERLSALFTEAGTPERCRAVVATRLRRGESVSGFGHPLYADGDPRAARLLGVAKDAGDKEAWRLVRSLARAGSELLHARPNLDFGLVAVMRMYGLPDYAPLALFALGRTVGWIAHAIEQYASGEMIRPRACYVGPPPKAG